MQYFWTKLSIITYEQISVGNIYSAIVDPGQEGVIATERLKETGVLLGIPMKEQLNNFNGESNRLFFLFPKLGRYR